MLGYKCKDRITGVTGVATVRSEYLNGCIQFGIQSPQTQPGEKAPDRVHIDEQQLTFTTKVIDVPEHHPHKSFEMEESVKSLITGAKGKITVKSTYIDGTVRYGYEPKAKPGKEVLMHWDDSESLVLTSKKKKKVSAPLTGGTQRFTPPNK